MSRTKQTQHPLSDTTLKQAKQSTVTQKKAQTKVRRKKGQPSKFTPELWHEILARISCGENPLQFCQDAHMPAYSTLCRWYTADAELKNDIRQAWTNATMFQHYVNDSILRGGVMSTGDFRRDEALVANNRWFMSKTNRRDFGDKTSVDLTSTVNIAMPAWANAIPAAPVIDGEIIDPDAIHEAETVKRIMDARKDQDPDA